VWAENLEKKAEQVTLSLVGQEGTKGDFEASVVLCVWAFYSQCFKACFLN